MSVPNYRPPSLSPQALRVAIRDIVALDAAGQLLDAEDEVALVKRENRQAHQQRTLGHELAVGHFARVAHAILGIDVRVCEAAALDVLFPNPAQDAARVLRLWAADIKRPQSARRA